MYCLYSLTNTVTAQIYIGITSRPKRRIAEHKSRKGSKYSCIYLGRAIEKYGFDVFRYEILAYGLKEDVIKLEISMIKRLKNDNFLLYNLSSGGEGHLNYTPVNKGKKGLQGKNKTTFIKNDNRLIGSKWCNNGIVNLKLKPSEILPDGYTYGRKMPEWNNLPNEQRGNWNDY